MQAKADSADEHRPMWLDLPTLSLRQQILDDFAAHRTPTGAVTMTPKRAKRKTGSERPSPTGREAPTASIREA